VAPGREELGLRKKRTKKVAMAGKKWEPGSCGAGRCKSIPLIKPVHEMLGQALTAREGTWLLRVWGGGVGVNVV